MRTADTGGRLDSVQRHLEQLQRQRPQGLEPSQALVTELLDDLQQTVDELRQQNEELTAAREAAEAERQRYQELFEFAPDGYVVTNAEGVIQQANRATAALLRMSRDALVHKSLILFVVEDERRTFRALLEQLKQGESVQGWEVHLQPLGLDPFPAMVKVGVARDVRGRSAGLRWLLSDVSEQKKAVRERQRAEEALAKERTLLRTLIDQLPDYIFIKDANSRFVLNNRAHLGVLGAAAPADVLGKTDFDFFAPALAAQYHADEQTVIRSGRPLIDRVEDTVDREGKRQWLLTTKVPLRDAKGTVTGLVGISHDITAVREAQRAAQQAERLAAIGQMVTGLAHESRNVLQASQVCLELLSRQLHDRPEVLEVVDRLRGEQARLHQLYEEVREYGAPIKLHRSLCHLAEIWREAWGRLATQRTGRDAVLQEAGDTAAVVCLGDRFRLEQVFRNLLENALAASADPVRIVFACAEADLEGHPAVQIRVRDNGPGLAGEQREKVFQPFFTTKPKGTGLGMAICKRLVEAHGGRLTVGNGSGPGAEFIITLPRNTA